MELTKGLLHLQALSQPTFSVGETAVVQSDIKIGKGEVTITEVTTLDRETAIGTGHSQWVQVSRRIGDCEMVFDSFTKQWALPENLSHFGQVHPLQLSGIHLSKVDQA